MKSRGGIRKIFGRGKQASPTFIGFRHPSGIGIRSKYYVIPLSRGASGFTRAVAEDGALTLIENSINSTDKSSLEFFTHTFLPRLASHPHTAGIFLIAVGDEALSVSEVAARIQALGTPCEYMALQGFTDMELAGSLALSTAQELKAMALSGLDNVDRCKVTITYTDESSDLPGLISLLEENSFELDIRKVSSARSNYLTEAAMNGAHAILSFVEDGSYPSGTVVTPVLNVASSSSLHKVIATDFDLPYGSTHAEILAALQLTFGMVPTNCETTGLNEPLFAANVPSLNDEDGTDEICLIPANPILIPFLIDLVSHQAGLFLKDRESFSEAPVSAKQVLVIGITASECQSALADNGDESFAALEDHRSFQQLAEAILSHR